MMLQDKVVLVTGGTGSLGKVLVRRLLSGELGNPAKVIVLSRDEGKQHVFHSRYQPATLGNNLYLKVRWCNRVALVNLLSMFCPIGNLNLQVQKGVSFFEGLSHEVVG